MFRMGASLLVPEESLTDAAPSDYPEWLRAIFPTYTTSELAEHHHQLWQWVWALRRGTRPYPLCLFLARGGAKSTSAEMACAAVGAHDWRRYVLYVSGKQDQADDHVSNVARMLESKQVGLYYPGLGERSVGKYGNSQGWRRNRIRTSKGLTVDALGLEVAARGVKLDEQRPDMIIFDDVDDTEDSPETVEKKIRAITQKLLPAGSSDLATLFVQNIVHYESVAARLAGLASKEADFLADRVVIGPVPALVGFQAERIPGTVKWRITSGSPTWEGQNRDTCQFQINDWGIGAFRSEAQHERRPPVGQAFPEWDTSIHVVAPETIPSDWLRYRAVDYGYAAPFCCLWLAKRPDGSVVVYRELYASGLTATEQAKQVKALSGDEPYRASYGDPSMWASTREGKKFKSLADQYKAAGITLKPATNDRKAGWERVHKFLEWDEGDAETPGFEPLLSVFSTCANLIRTFPIQVRDEHKVEDIDTDLEDHAVDALRYALMAMTTSPVGAAIGAAITGRAAPEPDIKKLPRWGQGRDLSAHERRLLDRQGGWSE